MKVQIIKIQFALILAHNAQQGQTEAFFLKLKKNKKKIKLKINVVWIYEEFHTFLSVKLATALANLMRLSL
jgi:hypothetical protein